MATDRYDLIPDMPAYLRRGRLDFGQAPQHSNSAREQPMAKKETAASRDTGKGTSAGHNVANIHNGVREAFAHANSLDDQIASLMEQHIKPLKEERTKIFRGLKKDFGIKSGIARAQYKLVRLAYEAQEFEKDEERAAVLDALAVTHEALHPGEQVDFVDVLKRIDGGINAAPAGNA